MDLYLQRLGIYCFVTLIKNIAWINITFGEEEVNQFLCLMSRLTLTKNSCLRLPVFNQWLIWGYAQAYSHDSKKKSDVVKTIKYKQKVGASQFF